MGRNFSSQAIMVLWNYLPQSVWTFKIFVSQGNREFWKGDKSKCLMSHNLMTLLLLSLFPISAVFASVKSSIYKKETNDGALERR